MKKKNCSWCQLTKYLIFFAPLFVHVVFFCVFYDYDAFWSETKTYTDKMQNQFDWQQKLQRMRENQSCMIIQPMWTIGNRKPQKLIGFLLSFWCSFCKRQTNAKKTMARDTERKRERCQIFFFLCQSIRMWCILRHCPAHIHISFPIPFDPKAIKKNTYINCER